MGIKKVRVSYTPEYLLSYINYNYHKERLEIWELDKIINNLIDKLAEVLTENNICVSRAKKDPLSITIWGGEIKAKYGNRKLFCDDLTSLNVVVDSVSVISKKEILNLVKKSKYYKE